MPPNDPSRAAPANHDTQSRSARNIADRYSNSIHANCGNPTPAKDTLTSSNAATCASSAATRRPASSTASSGGTNPTNAIPASNRGYSFTGTATNSRNQSCNSARPAPVNRYVVRSGRLPARPAPTASTRPCPRNESTTVYNVP